MIFYWNQFCYLVWLSALGVLKVNEYMGFGFGWEFIEILVYFYGWMGNRRVILKVWAIKFVSVASVGSPKWIKRNFTNLTQKAFHKFKCNFHLECIIQSLNPLNLFLSIRSFIIHNASFHYNLWLPFSSQQQIYFQPSKLYDRS